jgi:hypothetical protein
MKSRRMRWVAHAAHIGKIKGIQHFNRKVPIEEIDFND